MDLSERAKIQKILNKERQKKSKRHSQLYRKAFAYLEQYDSSRIWLTKLKSELTKRRYAKLLMKYCAEVGYNPDELIQLKLEGLHNAGTQKEWQAETLLETYLEKAKMKYNGKLMMKHAVISFYKKNRRPLAPDTAEKYEQLEKAPETYHMPSISDLDEMSKNATVRDEALQWFIESTSMRRGTIPKLTWQDLREVRRLPNGEVRFYSIFDKNKEGSLDSVVPIYIAVTATRMKGKYKGIQQHTFLHFLAYSKLIAYKKWLEHQLKIEVNPATPLFMIDRKPYNVLSGDSIRNAIVDLTVLTFGNGKTYSPHDLRRFTQTMLEKAKLPDNWVKKILGKKIKKEQSPYSLPKIVELHEAFKSAIVFLVPRREAIPETEMRKQVAEQTDKIATLEETLSKVNEIVREGKKQLEQKDKVDSMVLAQVTSNKEEILKLLAELRKLKRKSP